VPLEVHVVTPEEEVWSGDGEMVIARGTEGEVGILQGHAPLLIRLAEDGLVRVRRSGGADVERRVTGGFLHASTSGRDTRVDVLASGVATET
jgi:F-type H+-transporting ATPase subunit epsilon